MRQAGARPGRGMVHGKVGLVQRRKMRCQSGLQGVVSIRVASIILYTNLYY